MQTKLEIFNDSPTYAEVICKRVCELCDKQNHNPNIRKYRMLSIRDIINYTR